MKRKGDDQRERGEGTIDDESDGEYNPQSFVTVGTAQPVNVKDVSAKQRNSVLPLYQQERQARDERGRKRLHGAFKGGFSAGYFNTVGSKEGWQPAEFKSSRSERGKFEQKPEDFMDEDDLADLEDERRVKATETFDLLGGTEKELARRKAALHEMSKGSERLPRTSKVVCLTESSSAVGGLSGKIADALIVPASGSIGVKLLRKMGWRDGQGVGPRVKKVLLDSGEEDVHAANHLFAPQDITAVILTGTTGVYGLGFRQHTSVEEGAAEMSGRRNVFHQGNRSNTVCSRNFSVFDFDWSQNESLKNLGGFGTGVLDDDEDVDVYAGDRSRSSFHQTLDDEECIDSEKTHWQVLQIGKGVFHPAKRPLLVSFRFDAPQPPSNFTPLHRNTSTVPAIPFPEERRLNAEQRRQLLGEESLQGPARSVFAFIPQEAQAKLNQYLEQSSQKQSPESTSLSKDVAVAALKGFMPFGNDPEKQNRYRMYLEFHAGQNDDNVKHPPRIPVKHFSPQEERTELIEFAKAAQIFRPLSDLMAARFTSSSSGSDKLTERTVEPIKYGLATRRIMDFHPAKLLCKRFNVPNPYGVSKNEPIAEDKEVLNSKAMEELKSVISATPAQADDDENGPHQSKEELDEPPRPSLDIFKAIFADSDSDDDSKADEQLISSTSRSAPALPANLGNMKPVFRKKKFDFPTGEDEGLSLDIAPRSTVKLPTTKKKTGEHATEGSGGGDKLSPVGPRRRPKASDFL
ncbi:hypothetical protein DFJ73DRAFT_762131 [Zopfochytrium polystomum]|nr:hypothetical protein DFJ73DRAFT_762131 [Zopfochytrium polystomum]